MKQEAQRAKYTDYSDREIFVEMLEEQAKAIVNKGEFFIIGISCRKGSNQYNVIHPASMNSGSISEQMKLIEESAYEHAVKPLITNQMTEGNPSLGWFVISPVDLEKLDLHKTTVV
jgi:hypothetical protein